MALVFADLVQENTSTTGTGTLTLTGSISPQFQTFEAIGDANTTYYRIISGADSEVGIGTYTLSGTTLSRDTVLKSIIGGVAGTTKITVATGATVICTYPAERVVIQDANKNVNVPSATVGTNSANYQSLVGAVTTKTPIHSVAGTDSNIALALQSKGTGGIDLAAGSSGINISNGTTVISIIRTSGGTAYSTPPSVIISAPTLATGVQATATCTVTAGVVDTAFTITNAGSGYIEQPTITFSGGGGSGAAAYAVVGSTATKIQTLSPVLSFDTPAGEAFRIADFTGSGTTGYWGVFGPSISPQLRATSAGGTPILGTSGTQSLAIGTSSGVSQLVVSHTASAVNYVQVTGGATTADPVISVQGSDANTNLKLSGKGTGIVLTNQNAPVVKDATATLLIADVLSQIITSTSATAVTLTLPTGTSTDAGISGSAVNTAFEWSIINTGTTNAVTLAAGATHTIVGSGAVALSTSARFKTVKTATNTFITYRIA